MSNLYDDASLIMYPSGYKEDKIYSLKPTDGSGDLDFTRASTATRVNAEGLIEKVRTNLITYSEQFDNAAWAKSNTTVTANSTTSPDGTINADSLIENTALSSHTILNLFSVTSGLYYTQTFFVKYNGRRWIQIAAGSAFVSANGYVNFDLQDGLIGNKLNSSNESITSFGNGWFRISATFLSTATATSAIVFALLNGDTASRLPSYTGNGTSGVYIYGAQVELSPSATEYIPTTTTAVSVGMLANVPRIDYTGGGCGSLLLEKQSTNLATYSSEFNNASWTKTNVTISANSTTSPDGTTNADKIVADSGSSIKLAYQVLSSTNGVAHSAFAFYKADEYSYAFLRIGGQSPSPYVIYDLTSQSIVSTANATSTSIENYGNGWYRVSMTYTTNSTTNAPNVSFLPTSGYTLDSLNQPVYNGDGVSGGYIYGAQLEQSSYPTSYIPCPSSSSVTRLADSASKTGISSLIGQTQGTIFLDFDFTNISGTQVVFSIHDSANNKRLEIWANNSILYGFIGGSVNITIGSLSISNGRHKVALAYKQSGDHAFYIDGVQIGTSATAYTIAALTALRYDYWATGFPPTAGVRQTLLFPTRLTNTQLQSLTSL